MSNAILVPFSVLLHSSPLRFAIRAFCSFLSNFPTLVRFLFASLAPFSLSFFFFTSFFALDASLCRCLLARFFRSLSVASTLHEKLPLAIANEPFYSKWKTFFLWLTFDSRDWLMTMALGAFTLEFICKWGLCPFSSTADARPNGSTTKIELFFFNSVRFTLT